MKNKIFMIFSLFLVALLFTFIAGCGGGGGGGVVVSRMPNTELLPPVKGEAAGLEELVANKEYYQSVLANEPENSQAAFALGLINLYENYPLRSSILGDEVSLKNALKKTYFPGYGLNRLKAIPFNSGSLTGTDLQTELMALLPVIQYSIDLFAIAENDSTFSFDFTSHGTLRYRIDIGDVLGLEAALFLLKSKIYFLRAMNLNIPLDFDIEEAKGELPDTFLKLLPDGKTYLIKSQESEDTAYSKIGQALDYTLAESKDDHELFPVRDEFEGSSHIPDATVLRELLTKNRVIFDKLTSGTAVEVDIYDVIDGEIVRRYEKVQYDPYAWVNNPPPDFKDFIPMLDEMGRCMTDPPINRSNDPTYGGIFPQGLNNPLWEGTEPPTVQITGGPSGITYDTTPTFTFSGSDSDGWVEGFYVDVDDPTPDHYFTSSTSYTCEELTVGGHTFYVRAKDNDGFLSAVVSRRFTVARRSK